MSKLSIDDLYLVEVINQMPRLLSLLDRNPFSPTYGCFDRSYWHHRIKDFPSSTAQMSCRTLALIHGFKHEINPYYGNPQILEWARAGAKFLISIQHRDGSFDEWYPNERGWAGPTAYVGHALFETLNLLESEWTKEFQQEVSSCLKLAALHLSKRDEGHVLANHYALSLVFLKEVSVKFSDVEAEAGFERFFSQFLNLVSNEGWSLEYDGCDLAYNLGTLNFLVDLEMAKPEPRIYPYVERALKFLSHFAYPDGSFAGSLGSRHTNHSYLYGLEFWSQRFSVGNALLKHQRKSFKEGLAIKPGQQEDHYLHYRLSDLIRAAQNFNHGAELNKIDLPYEGKDLRLHFPESGYSIEKRGEFYSVLASKRGGVLKVFNVLTGKKVIQNNGWVGELEGRQFTSLQQGSNLIKEEKNEILVKGKAKPFFQKQFNPSRFILFRLVSLFMISSRLSFAFKVLIRRLMIVQKSSDFISYRRRIVWQGSQLLIEDEFESAIDKLWWGGEFSTRYVPQSNYFEIQDLNPVSQVNVWDKPVKKIWGLYDLKGEAPCVLSADS